ncbi:MAG: RecB-family nuclease [Candidatus Hodarchaeota archaeon]
MDQNIYPVLHNVSSAQRVREFAQLALGMGCTCCVISQAKGAAATAGVPAAVKTLAREAKTSLLYLENLTDTSEILQPTKVVLLISKRFAKTRFNPQLVLEEARTGKVLLVVGGTSPGLTRRELDMGEVSYIVDKNYDIGPIAQIAMALYAIENQIEPNLK